MPFAPHPHESEGPTPSLLAFTEATFPGYDAQWFHQHIAGKLDAFARGDIRRLMVFLPPQHGKSELTSRRLPAYLFGLHPDLRLAAITYSQWFAARFTMEVARIIDSPEYHELFPETTLGRSPYTTTKGSWERSRYRLEIAGRRGHYLGTSPRSGLTGHGLDVALIDDPIKGPASVASRAQRDRLWDWWTDVLSTRLHNDSRVLLTMTRWHEDDLAGRLLEEEGEAWEVLKLPALKEVSEDDHPADPRAVGEGLWEDRHSRERLEKLARISPRTFGALYQQHPRPLEGSVLKRAWLPILTEAQLRARGVPTERTVHLTLDTAYTAKAEGDPSCLLAFFVHENHLYIQHCLTVRQEFPQLIRTIQKYALEQGLSHHSKLYVEPKASGLSVIQELRSKTRLNVIEDRPPDTDKLTRAYSISPKLEGRRVFLCEGVWNEAFLTEVAAFPHARHDDRVDCLIMATRLLDEGKKSRIRAGLV